MKILKRIGNFLFTTLINLGLNIWQSIPAWALLALHFWLNIPIWLFWIALLIWIVVTMIKTAIVSWAAWCASIPNPPRENKNPYSHKD